MSEGELTGLPSNWQWITLDQVLDSIEAGRSFKCEERPPQDDEIGVVKVSAVTWGEFDESESKTCTDSNRVDPRFLIRPGDFLFSRANTINLVGTCVIVRTISKQLMLSDKILRLHFSGIEPKWILYALRTGQGRREIERLATGNQESMRNIGQDRIRQIRIPLAPPEEQKRIVAEIEKQSTDLDAGVAALKRVQANLKRYRASVLKAACEGRLVPTEAELARVERRDYEPAHKLLEHILKERREGWEAKQLAKLKATGRTPKDNNWKNKYSEPIGPTIPKAGELPPGWTWATIEQLTVLVQYGTSAKTDEDSSGVPVLRMGNLVDGRLDVGKLKYLPPDHDEFPDLLLQSGDILFNRTNSPELVGKTAVYGGHPAPCSFASYLIRARLADGYEPELLAAFINSPVGRTWVRSVAVQQVGQANVNGAKLQSLSVPVPPREEQRRIVNELRRHNSLIDATLVLISKNIARAERLRRAILQNAFDGKLVSQDPGDKPASILLDRIRQQRAAPASGPSTPEQITLDLEKPKKPRVSQRRSTPS